jgi:LPXTG-motif cell wall-anchored protein
LNKIVRVAMLLLVVASMFCGTVAANNGPGSAPNSGDGVSDGSGFESTTLTFELVIIFVILLIGLLLIFFLFKKRKKKL